MLKVSNGRARDVLPCQAIRSLLLLRLWWAWYVRMYAGVEEEEAVVVLLLLWESFVRDNHNRLKIKRLINSTGHRSHSLAKDKVYGQIHNTSGYALITPEIISQEYSALSL